MADLEAPARRGEGARPRRPLGIRLPRREHGARGRLRALSLAWNDDDVRQPGLHRVADAPRVPGGLPVRARAAGSRGGGDGRRVRSGLGSPDAGQPAHRARGGERDGSDLQRAGEQVAARPHRRPAGAGDDHPAGEPHEPRRDAASAPVREVELRAAPRRGRARGPRPRHPYGEPAAARTRVRLGSDGRLVGRDRRRGRRQTRDRALGDGARPRSPGDDLARGAARGGGKSGARGRPRRRRERRLGRCRGPRRAPAPSGVGHSRPRGRADRLPGGPPQLSRHAPTGDRAACGDARRIRPGAGGGELGLPLLPLHPGRATARGDLPGGDHERSRRGGTRPDGGRDRRRREAGARGARGRGARIRPALPRAPRGARGAARIGSPQSLDGLCGARRGPAGRRDHRPRVTVEHHGAPESASPLASGQLLLRGRGRAWLRPRRRRGGPARAAEPAGDLRAGGGFGPVCGDRPVVGRRLRGAGDLPRPAQRGVRDPQVVRGIGAGLGSSRSRPAGSRHRRDRLRLRASVAAGRRGRGASHRGLGGDRLRRPGADRGRRGPGHGPSVRATPVRLLEPDVRRIAPEASAPSADRAPDWMAAGTPRLLRRDLEQLLAPDRVLGRAIDLVRYASDASPYRLLPKAVVMAHDARDVARVLGYGRRTGTPVTLRAGGTSLNGQAQGDGILVDVRRHFSGIAVEADGRLARVKPGTVLGHANRVLAPYGRKLGPDPASTDIATVGGVIANNSGGMRCGVVRDSYSTLRSMTIVLPSGTEIDTAESDAEERFEAAEPELARGLVELRDEIRGDPELAARIRRKFEIKNTTGYRLIAFLDADTPLEIFRRLIVGSEGTLAFVAEAVFETVAVPQQTTVSWLHLPGIEEAVAPVPDLVAAGATAVELMVAPALIAASHSIGGTPEDWRELPPESAALLVEFGSD